MTIIYSKQAVKAIKSMNKATKVRIREGVELLPEGDVKPLRGVSNTYRLRVGDWRILFSLERDDTIKIKKIMPRGDAYKGV